MDANQIIANMNERWSDYLGNFYDHVTESFLKNMAEEYKLDYEALRLKSIEAKNDIINMVTKDMSSTTSNGIKKKNPTKASLKAAAKAVVDANREKNKFTDYTREELIQKCKEYKLPTRRKNQDMIDELLSHEDKNDIS
jgi:hypothetical protein